MLKFCPNVDQGTVIPILKFKESGCFMTVLALSASSYIVFEIAGFVRGSNIF